MVAIGVQCGSSNVLEEQAMVRKVNLAEALARFDEHWSPKIVGQVNDTHVKLAKLHGEFFWHRHDDEDELFFVLKGNLLIKLRDGEIEIGEGEFVIIPRGVEHLPVAREEVHVLLVEPFSTLNNGNVRNERTIDQPEEL